MPSNTDHVLTDLIAEVAALDAHLSGMSESDWSVPTPAPGWDVADQVIHLGLIDRRAMWSMAEPDRFVSDMTSMMASGGLDAIQNAEREKSHSNYSSGGVRGLQILHEQQNQLICQHGANGTDHQCLARLC